MTGRAPGKRDYYLLFAAQGLALVSTGIGTVGLALLAYRLAGPGSGAVFGTALAIKMVTYVAIAPLGAMLAERLPRRRLLVGLDLFRAVIVFLLPLVTEIWQIYVLIFLFQAASGIFTATYQSVVPELLPGEADYARALSRSRLLHEAESAISPSIAAALLVVLSFPALFFVAVVGFLVSAVLAARALLPPSGAPRGAGPLDRLLRGIRLFRSVPRLRGLAWLNLAAAAIGSLVTVNSIVVVQGQFDLGPADAAVALMANGIGSVAAALLLPPLRRHVSDRTCMVLGAFAGAAGLLAASAAPSFHSFLALWFVAGAGAAFASVPAGTVLRRSGSPADRQPLYVAQFALANLALLATYLLAGWVGATVGTGTASALHGVVALACALAALLVWPASDPDQAPPALQVPALLVEEEFRWAGQDPPTS